MNPKELKKKFRIFLDFSRVFLTNYYGNFSIFLEFLKFNKGHKKVPNFVLAYLRFFRLILWLL